MRATEHYVPSSGFEDEQSKECSPCVGPGTKIPVGSGDLIGSSPPAVFFQIVKDVGGLGVVNRLNIVVASLGGEGEDLGMAEVWLRVERSRKRCGCGGAREASPSL